MADYKLDDYVPIIDAIIKVADTEEVSVKRIRNALAGLFGATVEQNKVEVNELILRRYNEYVDNGGDDRQLEDRIKDLEKENKLMAAKLRSKSSEKGRVTKKAQGNRKSQNKSTSNSNQKNGFFKEKVVSPELREVIGFERCPRPQVVKQLWAYIKDHNLQDPEDKRQIICDASLEKLFKKKTVGAFEMNKLLSNHLSEPDEVLSASAERPENSSSHSAVQSQESPKGPQEAPESDIDADESNPE